LTKYSAKVVVGDMPRVLRIQYAGARYHVINRGNYRADVFSGQGAAEAFWRALNQAEGVNPRIVD
jgi:REP element-mobilizing transposase RayT